MTIKPLSVANPSFALDASARDCPTLQFVREFTVNGIEAITARRAAGLTHDATDQVVWRRFGELPLLAAPKLACVDTGIGLSAEELERYINRLASTSKTQGLAANYGMGAKIAGAVGNPAGLTYLSWTGGPEEGHTCTLLRESGGRWGLALDLQALDAVLPADPELCPREIQNAGWRGTVVVFHGREPGQDTTQPPHPDLGAEWLLKAINMRFYELPADIEVRCQRPCETPVRRALGQRAMLEQHTEQAGCTRLSDATVHWRILQDDDGRRAKAGGRYAASGHRAALHAGELYELRTASAGGYRKLQEFGIAFGYKRVVLYVEPDHAGPDTVRAHLVMDDDPESKDLPWERWADEFTAEMPDPLRELVESAVSKSASHDRRDFLRKLAELAEAMPIPMYHRNPDAGEDSASAFTHAGRETTGKGRDGEGGAGDQPSGSGEGNVVSLFTRHDGTPATRFDSTKIPELRTTWVSLAAGTRVPPVLEDMAATFLPRQSLVQLNEDFRGYTTLLAYFQSRYGDLPGAGPLVEAETKVACQNLVVEFIVGTLRLRSAPHWTGEAEEHALDDRALTACLMQHATLAGRIEERLARRVGKAAA